MKKLTLIATYVLVALIASAQSHSFRTTSQKVYMQFDLESWFLADPIRHVYSPGGPGFPGTTNVFSSDDILQYNYIDNPEGVEVVGISAVIQTIGPFVYPIDPPEYLLLYDAMPDEFKLKGQLQWEESDTADRPHYAWIADVTDSSVLYWNDIYGHTPDYYTIFDLYFDSAIRVYDSFYVGGTQRFFIKPFGGSSSGSFYFCYGLGVRDSLMGLASYTSFQPMLWKIYSYNAYSSTYITNQWYWIPTNQVMMVWPIINVVDTSFANAPECPRVEGLFVRGNNTDTVTVQ